MGKLGRDAEEQNNSVGWLICENRAQLTLKFCQVFMGRS